MKTFKCHSRIASEAILKASFLCLPFLFVFTNRGQNCAFITLSLHMNEPISVSLATGLGKVLISISCLLTLFFTKMYFLQAELCPSKLTKLQRLFARTLSYLHLLVRNRKICNVIQGGIIARNALLKIPFLPRTCACTLEERKEMSFSSFFQSNEWHKWFGTFFLL